MSIDLLTANFQDVSRDDLRTLARAHAVRGLATHGGTRAVYDSTKYDLVRGMEAARKAGKFGTPSTSAPTASNGNITVKAQNVILFLQGKGCGESGTYYVGAEAFKDGRVRLANCETEGPSVDDLDDYDNFWTTLDDLRDLVTALTQYANES
jgi:hypothetical protein